MQPISLTQTLNGGDAFTGNRGDRSKARFSRLTIDEYRARATLTLTTAVLGAGDVEIIAEDPEQWAVGIGIDTLARAVYDEIHELILEPHGRSLESKFHYT
jgi:hypothetical protein